MEKDTFMKWIAEIGESPRMKKLEPDVAEAIFDTFEEKYEGITKESFADVCCLVQNAIWIAPANSCFETSGFWNNPWMKMLRNRVLEPQEAPFFDEVMDTVLLFNMVYVVIESLPKEDHASDFIPKSLGLGTFFTLIYVVEVFIKLSVKSFKTYWSDPANGFDFITTWLLFGSWSLKYIHNPELQRILMRYANILRLFRLLRVAKKLKKYPRVQFMVQTVVKMVEAAGDILSLLSVVLFLFTTFSVNAFGGLLYEGNEKLEGSDYEEKSWYVFNFNDCIMAYTTWFTQLLCEYSPEWADALYRTSKYGAYAWYIFPTFYLLGVAIVFEIFKAFTIETYLALKEEHDAKEEGEDSESEGEEEEEDLAMVFEEENEILEAVRERLREENQSLHCRRSLLPALQLQINNAYKEALEEEEQEGEEGGKEKKKKEKEKAEE